MATIMPKAIANPNPSPGATSSPIVAKTGGVATKPPDSSKPLYTPKHARAHTIMIYGDSGSFKSWNALRFCEWVYKRTGKPVRYVLSDLGGYEDVRTAAEVGLINLVNLNQTESAMAAIKKLSRGEWPKMEDGKFKGFVPWDDEVDSKLCGGYVFDSLSSICFLVMKELVDSGRKISEDVVGKFDVHGESFGLVGRSHYGQAQFLARNLLALWSALPVEYTYSTALESKGEDEAKQTLYGPDTAGKALVDKLPGMLGDTFHSMIDTKSGERRMYFAHHVHPLTGIRFVTNMRLSGPGLQEWLKKYPLGYFVHGEEKGGVSIIEYLDHLVKSSEGNKERWKAMMNAQIK